MAGRRDGAGRDGQFAVQVRGIGHAAHVPELQQDAAAGLVHRARHQLPAFDLLGRPDARRVRVADAHRRDAGRFGQHQAGAGALAIVFGHHGVRHAAGTGPGPRQRGQHHAVRQTPIAHNQGIK